MTHRRTFKRLGILLLGAIVIAAVAAAVLIPKATRLHAGAVAYVEANVPQVVADWNADALRQRAAPELLQQSDSAQLDALFAWFSSLGKLVRLETPVGHIGTGTYPGSTFNGTWADYVANAQFEAGEAQVKIVLRRHDDSWRIIGFHITSAALLPNTAAMPTRHACPAQLQVDGQSYALGTVRVFDGPPADGRELVPEFDAGGHGHWAFVPGQDSFHLQCGYGESRAYQVIAATGATRCRVFPAQAGAALQGLCE